MNRNTEPGERITRDLPAAPAGDVAGAIPGEPKEIIRIDHLTKVFSGKKKVIAVSDVSLVVQRGEIFGLLGPNGAGKSTLIRILTTLMRPTSGTAWIDQYEVTRDEEKVRSIIGVCPQNSTLDVELTAYDNLAFYGRLVNVPEERLDARIWELLAMSGLTDRANTRVGTFSGGMKRKLEIVRAFIHHPLILFLDEPTIGLDPESRHDVWAQVQALNSEETTIILTTHYMDEAEKLCHRIAFMDQGRLMALDTPGNLKRSMPVGELIEIGVDRTDEALLARLRADPLVISIEVKEGTIHIAARNGSRLLPAVISDLNRSGIAIGTISIRSPSIEDVFLSVTGKGLSHPGSEEPAPPHGRR